VLFTLSLHDALPICVPSAFFFWEISLPLESVTYLSGTVMLISSVVFWLGLSIVGTHTEVASVSPCVHICVGLFFISPFGLMKYRSEEHTSELQSLAY